MIDLKYAIRDRSFSSRENFGFLTEVHGGLKAKRGRVVFGAIGRG